MFYNFTKRLLDIIGAALGLVIFSPVIVAVWVAIKVNSSGPAIFTQPRVTRGGKVFKMYKFRSMYLNADELYLHSNPKLLKKYHSNSWKLPLDQDPRVTSVGRFIRKSSLDELVQFLNVLKGEMSIVGPRAFRPEELERQQEVHPETKQFVKDLLTVKPGITGPWQVGGRSNVTFVDRVKLDAEYSKRRSLLYDLWIIIKTPLAVIHQEGAT